MTGRIAYEAYRNHTGGVSLATDDPIPEWDQLPDAIQAAWAAAEAKVAEDRDRLWDLLHEAAGWIKSYQLGTGDRLLERITEALDGEPIFEGTES